ncbi:MULTISPECIES: DUF2516 family protein [Corynebacterium]|uniref:DUF2516 family protein n=1 Tax=Corynebacterium guaraldiae TaxID=3051103 RepID=A0ABY3CWE7_9CORY|nr:MULTISPECIES: DUF2516 family protein [Corynebacterium]OFK62827.1 hypothetical protein HMPREF2808_10070 [Corynebacterium sp. HMSC078A10]OFP86390.1 hypothetical protein HMPREF2967_11520 [Corynebacterium sp. HMSC059E07]TRX32010.1 DUF2516 family protein [Corynebacterium guaraldiae]TRX50736.1 DUF2516 family protein [Corynebacterium guaraldiae]TRX52090.1 DUF2516 family protein [Corynebacterium guaraldiae]
MHTFLDIISSIPQYIFMAVSLFALIGAVLAAMTREDAFRAGDRQNKWVWVGLLVGSALVMNLPLYFVSWIGAIITGVYWFDVRPQLKAIINGDYSY